VEFFGALINTLSLADTSRKRRKNSTLNLFTEDMVHLEQASLQPEKTEAVQLEDLMKEYQGLQTEITEV
jgi:hypothetical protein